LVTSLVTALKAAAAVLAIIVVRKDIASKIAPTRERSSAAIVMLKAMRAENVRFPGTTLVSSVLTAKRWATPRSVASSQLLRTPARVVDTEAMLEARQQTTPVAAASVVLLLVAATGVAENLLLPAEDGRSVTLFDAASCRFVSRRQWTK